jgi:sugar O-acyltransferase (sialic acid O-acetyltransferase NeuD family)
MATAKPATKATARGRTLTAQPLIVVGGGEHARVLVEAIRDAGPRGPWTVLGYVDPAGPEAGQTRLGLPWLGTDHELIERRRDSRPEDRPWLVLGFGGHASVAARARTVDRYGPDARWATVIHPTAIVSPSAILEPGTVILAGAIVGPGARVGCHVTVNTRAVIEHDVELGDQVQVAPAAVIGGGTRVGRGTVIGLGALVRDHLDLGPGAIVGMGSVVVADVPADTTVLGSPARPQPRPAAEPVLADAGRPRG